LVYVLFDNLVLSLVSYKNHGGYNYNMKRRDFVKTLLTASTGAALAGCTVEYEDEEDIEKEIELGNLLDNISNYEGETVKTAGQLDYQGQEEKNLLVPQPNPDGSFTHMPVVEETEIYHLYEKGKRGEYIAVKDEGNDIDSLLEQDGYELVLTGEIVEYYSNDPLDYLLDVDDVSEP